MSDNVKKITHFDWVIKELGGKKSQEAYFTSRLASLTIQRNILLNIPFLPLESYSIQILKSAPEAKIVVIPEALSM